VSEARTRGRSVPEPVVGDDGAALRRLVDATPDIAWLADAAGALVHVNGRWRAYVGAGVEDEEGMLRVVHPDDAPSLRALWSESLASGRADETMCRLRDPEGGYRWHRARATAVSEPDGHIAYWFGSVVDVDEQRRAVQALQFVSKASAVLSESLDLAETLDRLLEVVVPDLADWAAIDLLEEHDRVRTVAVAHANPEKQSLVDQLRNRYTHTPQFERRVAEMLRTSKPRVIAHVTDDMIFTAASPRVLPVIRALAPHSTLSVPLRARGKTLGSLVAYWAESDRTYTEADISLFEELGRRASTAIENAKLYERERTVATAFQRAALPARLPLVPGVVFDAVYEPARDEALVGGDWYDAFVLADGRVAISIGDISGNGLGAAVRMVSLREVIRAIVQMYADPVAALDAADKAQKASSPDALATAFVGIIDPIERTLSYASAGHPPPFVRRSDGTVIELMAQDLPLGTRVHGETSASVLDLADGMMLVLYTDGVVEMTRDILAGMEELRRATVESSAPPTDAAHALFDAMLEDVQDDVAIMTVTFSHEDNDRMSAQRGTRWEWNVSTTDPAAVSALRGEIGRLLTLRGASNEERTAGELVAGELLANAVRYAPGAIEVVLDWSATFPVIHVLDRGPGFVLTTKLPSNTLSERGRGLFLVWSLAEDVNVSRRNGGGAHARAVLSVGGLRPPT
jgi:PAS domain S-box-containing protein